MIIACCVFIANAFSIYLMLNDFEEQLCAMLIDPSYKNFFLFFYIIYTEIKTIFLRFSIQFELNQTNLHNKIFDFSQK